MDISQVNLLGLLHSTRKRVCFVDSPGVGKTTTLLIAAIDTCLKNPEARGIIVCAIFESCIQAYENIIKINTTVPIEMCIKGSDANQRIVQGGRIIIGTLSELMNGQKCWAVSFIFLDDADCYFGMAKMKNALHNLNDSKIESVSSVMPKTMVLEISNLGYLIFNETTHTLDCTKHFLLADLNTKSVVIGENLMDINQVCPTGQTMIFCLKGDVTEKVANELNSFGHSVSHLSGKMSYGARESTLGDFRRGVYDALVTTEVRD